MKRSGSSLFITGKSKSVRRGKVIGKDGCVAAFIDDYAPVTTNGEIFL